MDPPEERRHSKRQNDYINMLGFVADSEDGIPRRCPCGGRIIHEICGKDDYDTLPGKRFFTCKNYEADGFHYRQPWVIGVQEEIERLTKRVEEADQVMMGVSNLSKQIETLEEQVKILSGQVDYLTVQVADLEKVCFE
uniref:Zinc finger GRF-type domain-containing protein n=1 Tax=Brassica oleracea var. oleracea TaxID=109376 RepID=A0A0D3DU05_BRAOL